MVNSDACVRGFYTTPLLEFRVVQPFRTEHLYITKTVLGTYLLRYNSSSKGFMVANHITLGNSLFLHLYKLPASAYFIRYKVRGGAFDLAV